MRVIGADAVLRDKPGFEVDFITHRSADDEWVRSGRNDVLMVMRGHWRLSWEDGEAILAPGDTCAVPPRIGYCLQPSMSGEASLYRARDTDDAAGATWQG